MTAHGWPLKWSKQIWAPTVINNSRTGCNESKNKQQSIQVYGKVTRSNILIFQEPRLPYNTK